MPKSMMPKPNSVSSRYLLPAALGAGLLLVGAGGWMALHPHPVPHRAPKGMTYTDSGYGGFVPASQQAALHSAKTVSNPAANPIQPTDPVQPLREAYNAGHYQAVETTALRLVSQARTSRSVAVHEQAAQARSLLAYSAARRHDLPLARIRFAAARQEAARLPDKGKQVAVPGEISPTLEEDAAYEHAVCTGALGNKPAAEAEYLAFMKRYPESPLVQASIKRIARMHGGDIPPPAEAVWRQSGQIAQNRQKARDREASLCGPECLSELLRRQGEAVDVHTLADEMHTSDRGTTLQNLAAAFTVHGFQAQGLALTPKGLASQKLPVVALITPGHYVLVDALSAAQVTVWDPDAHGLGHGASRTFSAAQWKNEWRGMTLALSPPVPVKLVPVRTAHR